MNAGLVIWQALPVASVDPALMDGLEPRGRPFAVIRKTERGSIVWGFHSSRKAAEAAMRRARRREIATR